MTGFLDPFFSEDHTSPSQLERNGFLVVLPTPMLWTPWRLREEAVVT